MASILSQAMLRIAAMQIQALGGITINGEAVEADAVGYFPYQQEAFPYWTNRITGHSREWKSDDIAIDTYTITSRLIIAHITEGYDGERANDMYEYIPAWIEYVDKNPFLTSVKYPDELDSVIPEDITITGSSGINAFLNSGIGVMQVGTDFTLLLPLLVSVY